MVRRLTSALVALSLLGTSVPALAAETDAIIEAPTELPCGGTTGKSRARCITDALKTWKELEHDYDEEEEDRVAAWKKEHAHMGVSSEYQKMLRDFLNGVRNERKEFRAQLQAFRKAFFAEQKEARESGRSVAPKPTKPAPLGPTMTVEEASAKCGPVDDDGRYRTCMRQLLRGVPANAARRSRTNTNILRRGL